MRNLFKKAVRSRSNTGKTLSKTVATLLAKALRQRGRQEQSRQMFDTHRGGMSLHNASGRKYLNAAERRRFFDSAQKMPADVRLFCLVLMWSGCRISEVLAITPAAIDLDSGTISVETLKKRTRGIIRQIPLPPSVLCELNHVFDLSTQLCEPEFAKQRLWPWSRSTGWRNVKKVMCDAGIFGSAAMPKGLRHAFGVAAFETVPPHLVQRWLGHSSLRTTAIYGHVVGNEERVLAERMWGKWGF